MTSTFLGPNSAPHVGARDDRGARGASPLEVATFQGWTANTVHELIT
jgi:hypothetical protein